MEVATSNPTISNNFIDMDFIQGQAVNIHGFRTEFIAEPEDADANANGMWAVWVLPGGVIQNTDLPSSFGEYGNEDFAPYLWGMGPWAGSNQNPAHIIFAPKSTRNMQNGGRIVLEISISGLSAGLCCIRESLTCFTTPIV